MGGAAWRMAAAAALLVLAAAVAAAAADGASSNAADQGASDAGATINMTTAAAPSINITAAAGAAADGTPTAVTEAGDSAASAAALAAVAVPTEPADSAAVLAAVGVALAPGEFANSTTNNSTSNSTAASPAAPPGCATPLPQAGLAQRVLDTLRATTPVPSSVDVPVVFHLVQPGDNAPGTTRRFDKIRPHVVASSVRMLNSMFAGSGVRFVLAGTFSVTDAAWFGAPLAANASDVDAEQRAQQRRGGPGTLNVFVRQLPEGQMAAASLPWHLHALLAGDEKPFAGYTLAHDGVVVDGATLPGATLLGERVPLVYASAGGALAHAVGHFLGLLDTSYGVQLAADGACVEGGGGDGCDDTPAHLVVPTAAGSCNSSAIDSCPGLPGSDPTSNIMATLASVDQQACASNLTHDQATRIRQAWAAWRSGCPSAATVNADALVLSDPGATNATFSISQDLLANDVGCDGATNLSTLLPGGGLRVRIEEHPSKGRVVLSKSGTLKYVLGSAWQKRKNTSDVFTYSIFDVCGRSSSAAAVTVSWSASLPRAAADTFFINASGPATTLDVLRNDGGSELFITAVSTVAAGAASSCSVNVAPDGRALEFTPPSTAGTVTLNYTLGSRLSALTSSAAVVVRVRKAATVPGVCPDVSSLPCVAKATQPELLPANAPCPSSMYCKPSSDASVLCAWSFAPSTTVCRRRPTCGLCGGSGAVQCTGADADCPAAQPGDGVGAAARIVVRGSRAYICHVGTSGGRVGLVPPNSPQSPSAANWLLQRGTWFVKGCPQGERCSPGVAYAQCALGRGVLSVYMGTDKHCSSADADRVLSLRCGEADGGCAWSCDQ